MDLEAVRYATFADLRLYCERVASAVGLASIEIFGYQEFATRDYAVNLGLALQLTNILRDVSSDAARGRLYFPLDDLARFGLGEADLMAAAEAGGQPPRAVGELLAFEADRAGITPAQPCCRSAISGPWPPEIMGSVYRALDEIERRSTPWGRRCASRGPGAWIALRALARAQGAGVEWSWSGRPRGCKPRCPQERRHEVVLLGGAASWVAGQRLPGRPL
jgi:phytoene synthase